MPRKRLFFYGRAAGTLGVIIMPVIKVAIIVAGGRGLKAVHRRSPPPVGPRLSREPSISATRLTKHTDIGANIILVIRRPPRGRGVGR